MIAEIGILTLGIAFVMAILSTALSLYGTIKQKEAWLIAARNALYFTLPLLTLSCLLLVAAQWIGEYQIAYVSSVSANAQPDVLKLTALWGGQAGSLMFYTWMLSLFAVSAVALAWFTQRRLMGWVVFIMSGTLAFFLLLSVGYENPFARTWMDPSGDDSTVETAIFQPEGKVVAYRWSALTLNQRITDWHPSDISAPSFVETCSRSASQIEDATEAQSFFAQCASGVTNVAHDGQGLNPLLRHFGMVIHPPLLYLGFTGFMVPFAFGMATMIVGSLEASWIRTVRRWTLVSWMFLTLGLILGGRWAYDVLGWGGYWGWDPVENSALLPWLTGTAFLHSVMIQEKRGMLKGWNMMMIILTYLLVVFGTVATRTGLLSSVHTFAQSPLAVPMGTFLVITAIGSAMVYMWRSNDGYFDGDHEIEGVLSRESIFLLNNWVFLALTVFVFWGTWAEKITDLMKGVGLRATVINLGPEYYEQPTAFLFGVIFLLMGIAPLVAWRRATANRVGKALRTPTILTVVLAFVLTLIGLSWGAVLGFAIVFFAGAATIVEIWKGVSARNRAHGENYATALYKLIVRNRRRYGGYIIHLGVVIMGLGIIGSTLFQEVRNIALVPGETVVIEDYTMSYNTAYEADAATDDRLMMIAETNLYKDCEGTCTEDNLVNNLRPRRDFFANSSPMSIAGTHSTLEGDFYVLLTHIPEVGDRISFRIYYNPLVNFVWFGGILMAIGTIVAAWPDAEPVLSRQRSRTQAPITVHAGAGD